LTLKVADIIDGRTFITNNQQTVRLKDVKVPSLLTVQGRRAKARLEELILHMHVECDDVTDDDERNLVAECWLEGRSVNKIMRELVGAVEAPAEPKPEPKKVEITIDESAFGHKRPDPTTTLKYPTGKKS
jgi:hypothetical protein